MVVPIGIDERPLLSENTHQTKPVDFGSDGCTCSLALNGRFLSIQAPHSEHGQMLAAPWQQFPADKAHDQAYVRQYRALPITLHKVPSAGFGMSISGERSSSRWTVVDGSWPRHYAVCATHAIETQYIATRSGVYALAIVTNTSTVALQLSVQLDFPISVHRAAYTQLTPKGDCSIPLCENVGLVKDGVFRIVNRHLGATLTATLSVNGKRMNLGLYQGQSALPLSWSHTLPITVGPGSKTPIVLTCSLYQDLVPAISKPRRSLSSLLDQERFIGLFDSLNSSTLAFSVLRNIDYILGCCLVPLGESGICVITDHQCLPLGWNRDNYWQMKMLHGLYVIADRVGNDDLRPYLENILCQHLVWVYETARRPSGHWARCYYTNGKPKDDIFQLDQQCYPLLELADIAELTEGRPSAMDLVTRLARQVDPILEKLVKHRRSDDIWLFETDETPGDDEVVYPYHFSSHVLLWHTLNSLGRLQERVGDVMRTPVKDWAAKIHHSIMKHFVAKPDDGPNMFAYLTSTTGSFQFYHDANDLPTVLAPRWGFCKSTSLEWRNTIDFAFSTTNKEGFYPTGPFGGLGSVHTRDPWPLGDGQALVLAIDAFGPQFDLGQVVDKLSRVAQWDGMFSEAVDGQSGRVSSKHWFSWPGSFIGYILMTWAGR